MDRAVRHEASASGTLTAKGPLSKREWTLYLPKAYHPLLLQQHRENLKQARKDLKNATAVSM